MGSADRDREPLAVCEDEGSFREGRKRLCTDAHFDHRFRPTTCEDQDSDPPRQGPVLPGPVPAADVENRSGPARTDRELAQTPPSGPVRKAGAGPGRPRFRSGPGAWDG